MFKWIVLLSALVLVQLAVANPTPGSFEKRRETLKEQAHADHNEFLLFAFKEIRAFFEFVLEKPIDGYADEIKSYKDFLEKSKDYEKEDFEKFSRYSNDALKLVKLSVVYDADQQPAQDSLVFQYFEQYVALCEKLTMKWFKCVEKLGHQIRDYLKTLTAEEKKNEVYIIYWYDRWTHTRDFSKRMEMIGEFFDHLEIPTSVENIYASKLSYTFENYTSSLMLVAESVHEEKFVKALEHLQELLQKESSEIEFVSEMIKFYSDFDKWLVSKGPSYFKYKAEVYRYTFQFFDNIDFYTELYIEYANVEPKFIEWFDDLKNTESFEESFHKYLNVCLA